MNARRRVRLVLSLAVVLSIAALVVWMGRWGSGVSHARGRQRGEVLGPDRSFVAYSVPAPDAGSRVVWCTVDDRDGDGVKDLCIAGAGGGVHLHSGRDGRELARFEGTSEDDVHVVQAFDAGDVDGDGTPDLALGAWKLEPRAYRIRIFGRDVIELAFPGAYCGLVQAAIPDVDGDGGSELALQHYSKEREEGGIVCVRAIDGRELWRRVARAPENLLSATAVGDVDGDGHTDLACGSNAWIFLLCGRDGSELWRRERVSEFPELTARLRVLGDEDGDGILDVFLADINATTIYSGRTGERIGETCPWWGHPLHDLDGDGRLESVDIGLEGTLWGPLEHSSLVVNVHSGSKRTARVVLASWIGLERRRPDLAFTSVADDFDGDSIPDLVLDCGDRLDVVSGADLLRP